jgi:dihydrofolate reductase
MRTITYYVAATLDGYISGPEDNIEGFVSEGSGIEKYMKELNDFSTVIMGRNTYEFGFKFGVVPGLPAYQHMDHYIFSESASYPNKHDLVKVVPRAISIVQNLKQGQGGDIYLCGGGIFAGWLLDNEMIDLLKIKLSPVVFGAGVKLFGPSVKKVKMELLHEEKHDFGMLMLTYKIHYQG